MTIQSNLLGEFSLSFNNLIVLLTIFSINFSYLFIKVGILYFQFLPLSLSFCCMYETFVNNYTFNTKTKNLEGIL